MRIAPLSLIALSLWLSSCSSMPQIDLTGQSRKARLTRDEEAHRHAFQKDRSAEDIKWLLRNRVDTGHTLEEVNRIIGSNGVPEPSSKKFRTQYAGFRTGDDFYRWGPDNQGGTYILAFRDGRLVNFDPTTVTVTPEL